MIDALAALTQEPDDGLGQIVESQGRRTDAVAHRDETLENQLDVRVIAERNRDESDARRVRPGGRGDGEDALGRKRADGQVVVTGPAEPAEVGAAAHDFDQQAGSELRVRREDAGARRIEPIGGANRRFLHNGRRAGARPRRDGRDAPGAVIGHVVQARDVHPAGTREVCEQRGTVRRAGAFERLNERGHEELGFAGRDHIRERRERFGIDERHRAADHDQRIARVTISGERLHPRQPHHRHHIGVVPFEGDGESEDVEIANRCLGLDGDERLAPRRERGDFLLRRQEHTLADHSLVGVEQPVDGLQAEIGHPDEIRVGERERDPQTAAMRLPDVPDFPRKEIASAGTSIQPAGATTGSLSATAFRERRHSARSPVLAPRLTRRRGRGSWYWRLYVRPPGAEA